MSFPLFPPPDIALLGHPIPRRYSDISLAKLTHAETLDTSARQTKDRRAMIDFMLGGVLRNFGGWIRYLVPARSGAGRWRGRCAGPSRRERLAGRERKINCALLRR